MEPPDFSGIVSTSKMYKIVQVIAFENPTWILPIEYNYSPDVTFKTSQQKVQQIQAKTNLVEEEDYFGFDDNLNEGIEAHEEDEKGFVEENFFLIIVGGCLAGIVVMVVLISAIVMISLKIRNNKRPEAVSKPEVPAGPSPVLKRKNNLSSREQRVLSLLVKSGK